MSEMHMRKPHPEGCGINIDWVLISEHPEIQTNHTL